MRMLDTHESNEKRNVNESIDRELPRNNPSILEGKIGPTIASRGRKSTSSEVSFS